MPALPVGPFLTTLISPACYAVSNICDNRLGDAYKNHITILNAQSRVLFALLLLPVLVVLHPVVAVSWPILALFCVVTALEYAYVYPYFWALRHTDTSIVVALFSLGKIVVPLLAWLFLGEVLQAGQYAGFFLIILASLLLTFSWRRFRFNRATALMLLASLMLAGSNIISKYIFLAHVSWVSYIALGIGTEGLLGLAILLIRPRLALGLFRQTDAPSRWLFGVESLVSGIGYLGYMLALSILPVTIVKGVSGAQPLFVLAYATVGGRWLPSLFNEAQSAVPPARKTAAFLLMIVAVFLTFLP